MSTTKPVRVRCSGRRYTITVLWRDPDDPARRVVYTSAIQALHAIRMLIVGSKRAYALEQTAATQAAFDALCTFARQEIDAAIRDVYGTTE